MKEAFGLPLGGRVAIKRYKQGILDQAGQPERLIRELEIGRRIRHPNLVQTFTIISEPDGRPALVMRYYEGETLEAFLTRQRTESKHVEPTLALKIVGQLAGALATLHEGGAIHRDVKPANIMLTSEGPILMDLGVVRTDEFPEQITTGEFLGTIRYAAPEYLFGDENGSPGLDVYSLTAVAWELFTGQRFLGSEDHWGKLVRIKAKLAGPPYSRLTSAQDIERRIDTRTADFIRIICSRGLADVERRHLDLAALEIAVQEQRWTAPYYFADGKFHCGHGAVMFPEGCEEHPGALLPVEKAVAQACSILSSELFEMLLDLLREHFWEVEWEYYPRQSMQPLVDAHAVCYRHRNDNTVFWFPAAILVAYRNGLLTDATVLTGTSQATESEHKGDVTV